MKAPVDGWDRDEREALEELREELEILQARHHHDPGIDVLRAARHDALPPDLQSSVERRLASDPWSRALVEGLDDAEPALDNTDQDRLLARITRDANRGATPAARWTWLSPVFVSAGLAAIAASAWIAYRTSSTTPQGSPVKPEQTIASTPTPPPVFQLPLDKPDITVSLAALTWRGSGADNQLLGDLKSPLDAFREGDYPRADREFTALEPRYPDAVEVFFYGGVSRLFSNDPPRALVAFARAGELADAVFAPRVAWYRAIAEQRTGNLAQARGRLDELCRGSGERAAQACEAVKQIDATSGVPHAR